MEQEREIHASRGRMPFVRSVLVGVLAVLAALTVGHLIAGFLNPNASPFYAVGNTAIDLTPSPLKDFAVRNFGTDDKLVLLGGMAVVLLLFAAVAGLLSRRSPWPGVVLATMLGALGIAAVLTRPDTDVVDVLAPVGSLVAGVGMLLWLHALASRSATVDVPAMGTSRRRFMYTSTGSGESFKVDGANVVCGNVRTANATVYIIDSVLMPPAA